MKKKRILCAALAGVMVLTAVAAAAGAKRELTVDTGMSVMVNGEEFHPKDASGKDAMIFAFEGTTYAPLRALAETYGLAVGWDQAKSMVTVDGKTAGASGVTAPDPHVEYILQNLPRTDPDTGKLGDPDEVYYDCHWRGFEEDEKLTAKVVEGSLPDGITLSKDGIISGPAAKELETMVTVEVTGRDRTETFPVLFRFQPRGTANFAPIVIYGAVGDYMEGHLNMGPHNGLYLEDTLYREDDFKAQVPDGPIGTQAGLDALKAYGLELEENILTNPDDNDFAWGEYVVSGVPEKGTDGWVKVEVPVFPCYSMGPVDENGDLDLGLSMDFSHPGMLAIGTVEVYLNIIDFG